MSEGVFRRLTEAERGLYTSEWTAHPGACEIVDADLNPVFRVANINGRDIAVCDSAIGHRIRYRWWLAAPLLDVCPDDPPFHYNGLRYVTACEERRQKEAAASDREIRKWKSWWNHAVQCRDDMRLKFELHEAFRNRLFD